jgi:hypothetical protein
LRSALLLTVAVLGCATAQPAQPSSQAEAATSPDAGGDSAPPAYFTIHTDGLRLRFNSHILQRPALEYRLNVRSEPATDPSSRSHGMGDFPPNDSWDWPDDGDFPMGDYPLPRSVQEELGR